MIELFVIISSFSVQIATFQPTAISDSYCVKINTTSSSAFLDRNVILVIQSKKPYMYLQINPGYDGYYVLGEFNNEIIERHYYWPEWYK